MIFTVSKLEKAPTGIITVTFDECRLVNVTALEARCISVGDSITIEVDNQNRVKQITINESVIRSEAPTDDDW